MRFKELHEANSSDNAQFAVMSNYPNVWTYIATCVAEYGGTNISGAKAKIKNTKIPKSINFNKLDKAEEALGNESSARKFADKHLADGSWPEKFDVLNDIAELVMG